MNVERLLVIRYSALGDVVLATSVLEPLRRRFPGARIELVTSAAAAPLLEGLPGIAAVHRLGRRGRTVRGPWPAACAAASTSPSTCRRR